MCFDYYVEHLITCINDQKIVLSRIVSVKETNYGNFLGDRMLLISLMEPTIEYTMRCIFKDPNQVIDLLPFGNIFRPYDYILIVG